MPTNKPEAIASFPKDRTNAFGDVRAVMLAAVARVRNSQVKKDDLDALLDAMKAYNAARFLSQNPVEEGGT